MRHQRGNGAPHHVRAEEHGLDEAPRPQQPVGEDMAALGVAAELDLVHRHEIRADLHRHGLDGADPVLRPLGNDPLLAGHERHDRGPRCATIRS